MAKGRQRKLLRRRHQAPQSGFAFEWAETGTVNPNAKYLELERASTSYRELILNTVNALTDWKTAREISVAAGLTYVQTIFALQALHGAEEVARKGRKNSSMWGPLALDVQPDTGFDMLQSLFNSSVKRG